jgi:cellulase/cellobiase CelA1
VTALWGGGTAQAMGPLARFTCDVDLTIVNQWSTGYVADLTINNTGTEPFSPWTLQFELPGDQLLGAAWNGVWTQVAPIVQVRAPAWASGLAAGGSAEVGFVVSHTGAIDLARNFTLNGVICTV